MWSRREVMTLKKLNFISNRETNWTNWCERQSGNISMIYYWNTSQIWKKSWQVIKSVINIRKNILINTKSTVNSATLNDGNVIANKFNNLFVNVGTVLVKSIPPSDKNPVDYIQQVIITNLYFDPTTENEICKIIGSFKDSAAGWDDVKSNM